MRRRHRHAARMEGRQRDGTAVGRRDRARQTRPRRAPHCNPCRVKRAEGHVQPTQALGGHGTAPKPSCKSELASCRKARRFASYSPAQLFGSCHWRKKRHPRSKGSCMQSLSSPSVRAADGVTHSHPHQQCRTLPRQSRSTYHHRGWARRVGGQHRSITGKYSSFRVAVQRQSHAFLHGTL